MFMIDFARSILEALRTFILYDKSAIVADQSLLAALDGFLSSVKESHCQQSVSYLQRSLRVRNWPRKKGKKNAPATFQLEQTY
jgi:hypothetical protein